MPIIKRQKKKKNFKAAHGGGGTHMVLVFAKEVCWGSSLGNVRFYKIEKKKLLKKIALKIRSLKFFEKFVLAGNLFI